MKYYSIEYSLNKKILGKAPQVKSVIYHCDIWNDPMFIGEFHFQKIDIDPIVGNPILNLKANRTDLIEVIHTGFTFYRLISGKLKSILEKCRKTGIQFIQCSVFQNGIEYKDYWLLNMYEINNDYVDFEKSTAFYRKQGATYDDAEILHFHSLEEFNSRLKVTDMFDDLHLENITIKDNVTDDFFLLKSGVKYVVSEKLKEEIETAGCTGIEFMPTEIPFNKWLNNEREKIYGKA